MRKITISNTLVTKFMKELAEIKKNELKPAVEKLLKKGEVVEPFNVRIQALNADIQKIKDEMRTAYDEYKVELSKVEGIEARMNILKEKVTPIIKDETKDVEIGEFEEVRDADFDNNIVYVNIVDLVEEFKERVKARKEKK